MANQLKGYTVKIGGNTTDLQKALGDVNKKSKSLSSELGSINKLLKLDPKNTDLLAQKQEVLSKAIGTAKEKLNTLEEAQKQVNEAFEKGEASEEQVREIERAVIEASNKVKTYEKALEETNEEVEKAEKDNKGASKEERNLGEEAKKAGQKVLNLGKDAIKSATSVDKLKSVANGVGKALKATGVAFAAVGAGAVAVGKKTYDAAKEVADYGDEVDKASQKMGVSAEEYQKLSYAAELSGTSIDKLKAAQLKLTKEGSKLTLTEALKECASAEDATAKATELFGAKIASELTPMLNAGADGIEAMMQEAEDYGMVLSNDAVKASANFQDSLSKMQGSFKGIKNEILGQLMPSLTTLMLGVTELMNGSDKAGEMITKGVQETFDKIGKVFDQLLDVFGKVIQSVIKTIANNADRIMNSMTKVMEKIIEAVIDALPDVMKSALSLMETLLNGILSKLPELADTALKLIVKFADSITQSLPKMVPQVVNIITKIVDVLIKNAPTLAKAAVQIIVTLATSIIKELPRLLKKVPQIIYEVAKTLNTLISGTIGGVGKNLLEGLWNGISNKIQWIKEKIKGMGSQIITAIKGVFGIHSPSKETAKIGRFLSEGLAVGIEEEADKPARAFNSILDNFNGVDDINIERAVNGFYSQDMISTQPNYEMTLNKILQAIKQGQIIAIDGKAMVNATKEYMDKALGLEYSLRKRGVV